MLSDELFLEYEPVESESATTKNYDCTNYDANDSTCAETVVIVGSLRIVRSLRIVSAGCICAGSVVGISFTALALALNKAMLVRRYVVGIGLAALALAFNEGMLVRSYHSPSAPAISLLLTMPMRY